MKILRGVMQVLYANNKYAKYSIQGGSYFIAILGASFYLFLTVFFLGAIIFCLIPGAYKAYLNLSLEINSIVFGIAYLVLSIGFIKLVVKEEEIKSSDLSKEEVSKSVNYLIAYSIGIVIVTGFLILKVLKP